MQAKNDETVNIIQAEGLLKSKRIKEDAKFF
jgi:hypothetical protein